MRRILSVIPSWLQFGVLVVSVASTIFLAGWRTSDLVGEQLALPGTADSAHAENRRLITLNQIAINALSTNFAELGRKLDLIICLQDPANADFVVGCSAIIQNWTREPPR